MKVYLFRHGQKNSFPLENPDLTGLGHQQAAALAEQIRAGALLRGTRFLASPRLRAQNTLKPASELCQSPLQVVSFLDQKTAYETGEAFRDRIRLFLDTVEKNSSSEDVVYLCSHHDWIEESLSLIPADTDLLEPRYWNWRPAQYMQFDVVGGLWHLKNFNRIEPSC